MTSSIPDYDIQHPNIMLPNIPLPFMVVGYWTKAIVVGILDCYILHPLLLQMHSPSLHYAEFARLRKSPKG